MFFDKDVEAAKLKLKKTQTAQNISLTKLAELLQQLNETETQRLSEPDMFTLDNETTIMPGADDTNSDNHNSHKD